MRTFCNLILIIVISFSFTPSETPFVLVGHVESQQGIVLPNIYIQVWKDGDVINQTKTDNFGNYRLPLSKIGVFTIIAGNKNKYFHPNISKEFKIGKIGKYKKDFNLLIDKQILQRETTRLRESYNHMMKNPKNLSYKRAFFKQFPNAGYETELFFNKHITHINLKKESKTYMNAVFKGRVAGWTGYMLKFIRYGQKTNMKVAGPMTKKFYAESCEMIKQKPLELFRELSSMRKKKVNKFFVYLFSGGAFGKSEPDSIFDFLSGKYSREYNLMQAAFEENSKSNPSK